MSDESERPTETPSKEDTRPDEIKADGRSQKSGSREAVGQMNVTLSFEVLDMVSELVAITGLKKRTVVEQAIREFRKSQG